MTIKEFEEYKPEGWKCPKCKGALDALDLQEPYPKGWCSDCYYNALGDEIECNAKGLGLSKSVAKRLAVQCKKPKNI